MPVELMDQDHNLADLIGKKIKDIRLEEVDVNGDGDNIREFYKITCSDGECFVLACDGGADDIQQARAELWSPEDYEAFIGDLENEDSEDEELDEDDADFEDADLEQDD